MEAERPPRRASLKSTLFVPRCFRRFCHACVHAACFRPFGPNFSTRSLAHRWRDFLTNCHTVQARLHDIGVAVGAAIVDPSSLRVRKKLYTLYRYMNVAHAKTYASVCAALPQSSQACIAYRLLTEEEVNILEAVENKSRCVLYTGPHATAFAWCTPFLSEEFRVRFPPHTPRCFQSPTSTSLNST